MWLAAASQSETVDSVAHVVALLPGSRDWAPTVWAHTSDDMSPGAVSGL